MMPMTKINDNENDDKKVVENEEEKVVENDDD